jgi:hypothetical protein
MDLLHAFYTNMRICGIIINMLASLNIHTVDMCNITIKIQNI